MRIYIEENELRRGFNETNEISNQNVSLELGSADKSIAGKYLG